MEDKWLENLKQGKCMTERDLKILCEKVTILITFKGERNSRGRIERPACKRSSDSLW